MQKGNLVGVELDFPEICLKTIFEDGPVPTQIHVKSQKLGRATCGEFSANCSRPKIRPNPSPESRAIPVLLKPKNLVTGIRESL